MDAAWSTTTGRALSGANAPTGADYAAYLCFEGGEIIVAAAVERTQCGPLPPKIDLCKKIQMEVLKSGILQLGS